MNDIVLDHQYHVMPHADCKSSYWWTNAMRTCFLPSRFAFGEWITYNTTIWRQHCTVITNVRKDKFFYGTVSNPQDCSKHRYILYSRADLFNHTTSRFLWEAFSHTAINTRRLLVHKCSQLSIARYTFIQPSELEQCRVKKLAQSFTWQQRIRTWVLLVKGPMLYPWATELLWSVNDSHFIECSGSGVERWTPN